MKSDNRWIWITIGSIIVIFAVFSVLLWKIVVSDFTGNEASAKIVAASIALIGGFIGSLATVIGVLLKHSIDQRNADLKQQAEERLRIESERNNSLREEGEKRLKVEAAIQSVQLLSTSSGKEASITQRACVLFTLVSLGLPELALKMLNQMLPNDRIDAFTASWLIDHSIKSSNESLQDEAVIILKWNIEKFLEADGTCSFPNCFLWAWDTNISEHSRGAAAVAILKLIVARPYSDWHRDTLNSLVFSLKIIWETEPSLRIKNGVALCLEKILRKYPINITLSPPNGEFLIDDLRTNLLKCVKNPNFATTGDFVDLSLAFEHWSKTKPSKSQRPLKPRFPLVD